MPDSGSDLDFLLVKTLEDSGDDPSNLEPAIHS